MGRWERMYLFVSYQRYSAFLFSVVVVALAWGAPYFLSVSRSWSGFLRWPPLVLFLILLVTILRFTWSIASKWPRKLRATRLAIRRIESGRFSEGSIEKYCDDPCFRVVANEILRRAGLPKQKRKTIIAYYKEKASQPLFVMTIDANAPEPVRVEGALYPRDSLTPNHTQN